MRFVFCALSIASVMVLTSGLSASAQAQDEFMQACTATTSQRM